MGIAGAGTAGGREESGCKACAAILSQDGRAGGSVVSGTDLRAAAACRWRGGSFKLAATERGFNRGFHV